jgi:hypothetical protein
MNFIRVIFFRIFAQIFVEKSTSQILNSTVKVVNYFETEICIVYRITISAKFYGTLQGRMMLSLVHDTTSTKISEE